MNQASKLTLAGLAVACCATLAQTAQAGGISLYEIATPGLALASAGYAARAEDASTVFKNPAGISQVQGAQFQGGLQALYGSVRSRNDCP